VKYELRGRYINQGRVEVDKEEEKKEKIKENLAIEREDRGRYSSKEDGSWKTHQEEEFINQFFGAPHKKEGKIGW
jgi:hypothetical protein